MANFLKIGNSRQNYETDKAIGKSGDFDVNAGEVVEVSFSSATTSSAQHRISDPVGAILIDVALELPVGDIYWTSSPNSVSVTLGGNRTGTLKFLVF